MRVDSKKQYRTVDGQRVINIHIVPKNSAGNLVTFPVKGSIVISEKPLRFEYAIWTMEGYYYAGCSNHPTNLVEEK